MRINKNLKAKYDLCIEYIIENKDKKDFSADVISCFPFLNYVDESKHFSNYCLAIEEVGVHCFVRDRFVLRINK